mmetsp:Transcript_24766/g.28644  ORF Transcript_24766/g.28644 Transcript_24766/m.28644 type:complete len:100 (-) Transcript_24766:435-734(-)
MAMLILVVQEPTPTTPFRMLSKRTVDTIDGDVEYTRGTSIYCIVAMVLFSRSALFLVPLTKKLLPEDEERSMRSYHRPLVVSSLFRSGTYGDHRIRAFS